MPTRPATFISDELIHLLESTCLSKASFLELSGVQYPWDVTANTLSVIREALIHFEKIVRTQCPFQTLICLVTGDAVYWIDEIKLGVLQEQMRQTIQDLNENGPMPVWKSTTAEILTSHLRNIKRLILAVVHDSILLQRLRNDLKDQYKIIHREFQQAERNVLKLLHLLCEYGPKIACAMNQDLIYLERCKITQTMIEQGEITQEELGYSEDQLNRVIDRLNDRCLQALPGAMVLFRSIHNYSMNALRDGESSQLLRASRWEILFSLMDDIPKDSVSYFQLMTFERSGLSVFVDSRERELGASSTGREAITKANEAKETRENKEEKIVNEEETEESVTSDKKEELSDRELHPKPKKTNQPYGNSGTARACLRG